MEKPTSYDHFLALHPTWQVAIAKLHACLLDHGFEVAIKWNMPVYMLNGKNKISIGAFKKHFALWFFQGDKLSNQSSLLINAQPGKTKEMRHLKWTKVDELDMAIVEAYIAEVKALEG